MVRDVMGNLASWARRSLLALLVVSAGCMNASTLQTARVLPPGDQQALVGGGMTTLPGAPESLGKALASLPYGEIGYRYGLLDSVDVGAHVTLLGTGGLDAKWQFFDRGPLAMATGLNIGYMTISASSSSSSDATTGTGTTTGTTTGTSSDSSTASEAKTTLIDVVLPLYVSYDVGSHLTAYGAPKYLLRAVMSDSGGGGAEHMLGTTAGIKLGDSFGMMLESTFMRNLSSAYNLLQYNIAIFWSR